MTTINDRFREFCRVKKITQGAFAEAIEIHRQSVSDIFRGKYKPGADLLEKTLKRYLDINARWLITGEGEMLEESKTNQEQPADFGKDLPRLLMEKSEECGVLRTKLEQAEDELAEFRAGGSGRESDGKKARAG